VIGPTTQAADQDKCPSPLAWHQVLREFHSQADAWFLDRPKYRISGRTLGCGPPLYLLNGLSATHELYALLVWLLRDRYRCVLFDYAMPAARGPVTLDDLADDLIAVGEACGDATWDVFASSFGCLVALSAMRNDPRRIGRAVLQGAFARRQLSPFERLLIRAGAVVPGKLRHIPLRVFVQEQSHRRWFPPFDPTRWQFFLDNSGSVRLAELAGRSAIVRDCDLRQILPEVCQPILLVRSEGDGRLLERAGQELAGGLRHSRVESLVGAGPISFLTHPHRLAKLIGGFLEQDAP